MKDELTSIIAAGLAEPDAAWMQKAMLELVASDQADRALLPLFAGAGRRARGLRESARVEAGALLASAGAALGGWDRAAVVRAALLLETLPRLTPEARRGLATELFVRGDNAERCAVLRSLAAWPEPAALVGLAVEACRTNVQDVFEAIACANPYPARWFAEAEFNQLVLKALFTGVRLERIDGLAGRRNPELARMAKAYASERRAAGRSVPSDIEAATEPPETQ